MAEETLADSPTPGLDARLLLEHVVAENHAYLVAHDSDFLNRPQVSHYHELLDRAARREPIPYIIGYSQFYGFELKVAPPVLIPRPETERLVEFALEWLNRRFSSLDSAHIVDVGTGSGCIAIALARAFPRAIIEATDVSSAALEIARQNTERLDLSDRIRFHQGCVANLPYIADHEWTSVDGGVKWFEPDVALRGGSDGLDSIRQLLRQAGERLAPSGAVFLEIGWQQGKAANLLARSTFPSSRVDILPDYAGRDRVLRIVMT
jgi:release factor glutamine methyltransferase